MYICIYMCALVIVLGLKLFVRENLRHKKGPMDWRRRVHRADYEFQLRIYALRLFLVRADDG